MENQPLLDGRGEYAYPKNEAKKSLLPPRPRYHQYIDEPPPETFESGPGLLAEYLQILRHRRGTLILITFLGFLTALLLTLPQTPIYQARASIEIQSLNQNFLNMRNVNPTADDSGLYPPESDLQTQVKILQSQSLLEEVAAKLNLGKKLSPVKEETGHLSAWLEAFGLRDGRQKPSREKILALIAKNLDVRAEPNTRLVEIRYDSTDPQFAANVVNTLTTEFVQQNLESRWKTSQQTGKWLTQQMEGVRIKLEKSEDQLQHYALVSGLSFTSEKDNVAEDKLRQLQEEFSKAQEDRVAKQSRYEVASTASPESLPEVLDDGTLKEYQVKLTDLRRQLAELLTVLTPAHPAVRKIQAQVTTLDSALKKERTDIVQRIRNEFESARLREQMLATTYADQARLVSEQAAEVTHYNILKRQVDTNRELYDSMLHNVQQANMTSALRASNIRVVDSARPPTHPYKPNFVSNSALGLLAGAFFGLIFIVVQERCDRSIQGPGDTAQYLDMPELGAIPTARAEGSQLFAYYQHGKRLVTNDKSESSGPCQVELITSNRKPSVLADAFRATLTSILFSGKNGNWPRIIVITSTNPIEGKTTVACNLALALAEIGPSVLTRSVLLIDGDLRRPRLHEIFGVPNGWGLSDLLEGKEPPSGNGGMFFKTGFRNLNLLPSGSPTVNVAALLHSQRMLAFMNHLREGFHTVIIDTPPILNLPDARVVGRLADGVILVVQSARTTRDAALAAKQRLTEDGTHVLGTVLNQWDPRMTNQYSYGYRYKYYQ